MRRIGDLGRRRHLEGRDRIRQNLTLAFVDGNYVANVSFGEIFCDGM